MPRPMALDGPVTIATRFAVGKVHVTVDQFAAFVAETGWEKFQRPDNQYLFVVPETTLAELARQVAKQLDSSVLRVVGEREMKVTKVGFSPGAAGSQRETNALELDDVQVLVVQDREYGELVVGLLMPCLADTSRLATSMPCVRVTRSMVTRPESSPAASVPVSLSEPPTSQLMPSG